MVSSDEDTATNQIAAEDPPISEEDYRQMLRVHREKQIRKKVHKRFSCDCHVILYVITDGHGCSGQRVKCC